MIKHHEDSVAKMKTLLVKFIRLLSYIPFIKSLYQIFYLRAIQKIKIRFEDSPEVEDILLTSNIKSKDFIFGTSDLNFLIIVDNDCHPKAILNDFRLFVQTDLLLSLTVNQVYIPILTKAELQTDTIKSFLIRRSGQDIVKWKSVISEKDYIFHLRKQDHFAIVHNSIQNLDYFFLKEYRQSSERVALRNTNRSIFNLQRFFPNAFPEDKKWSKLAKRIQGLPGMNTILAKKFYQLTWKILTDKEISYKKNQEYQEFPISKDLVKYLQSLLKVECINDFTLTPSLIQQDPTQLRGKLFIDIHVNKKIVENKYFQNIEHLIARIKDFETFKLKLRIRVTTDSLYQMQNEFAYYPFPLEALFRQQKSISLAKREYDFLIIHDQIVLSAIHFLTSQFMRFRSLKQKTDLIGSKFIKSLNLMYKYHLLVEYLKGRELNFDLPEEKIREQLTPQFSELELIDIVTEEHWKIIKAQLLYLLKEIRDELIRYDASLKVLRF